MDLPAFNVKAHVMNESRSLRAFENVSEGHGGELYGLSLAILVLLHSVLCDAKSLVDNTPPVVRRPKFHPLASCTEDHVFEHLAAAILHVSGKRIDTDARPALLLERFCIRHVRAVSRSHIQEEAIGHTRKNFLGHPYVLTHLRIKGR